MTTEFLVVRLDPAPGGTANWAALDDTGALIGSACRGRLEEAASAASGRRVVVLVPATDVLRTRADVPVRGNSRIQQALPFALEEQVADEIEALHFAAGARDDTGRLAVAVVRRDTMERWRQELADAGIAALQMYSVADAVGHTPNTCALLVQADAAILAAPDGSLTALDADTSLAMLELWLARHSGQAENEPVHVVVYAEAKELAGLTAGLDALRDRCTSLDCHVLTDGALPRLAAQIITAPGVDLLQGAFARRSSLRTLWPAWRPAAGLAAAVIALALLVQLLEVRTLRRELATVDAEVAAAFTYVFPDAGPVTDPRAELSARLARLGNQGTGASQEFLDTLDAIGRAVAAGGNVRLEGFNYRSGSVELRIRAPSVEALDRVQQSVTGSGNLRAQIQSANSEGEAVVGRLQITRGGS